MNNLHIRKESEDDIKIDVILSFGAWLVNNHEVEFSGGEEQIAVMCADFAKSEGLL